MNRYHQYTVGIDLRQQAMALMHALGNPDSRLPTRPLVQDNRQPTAAIYKPNTAPAPV